jgi:hypothetical protein
MSNPDTELVRGHWIEDFFSIKIAIKPPPHQTSTAMHRAIILSSFKAVIRNLFGAICCLGLWSSARGQAIINLDLGNNALATQWERLHQAGDWERDLRGQKRKFLPVDQCCEQRFEPDHDEHRRVWRRRALDADGLYNIAGNGAASFTLSNVPAGMTVTLYACWAWNGAAHAPIIFTAARRPRSPTTAKWPTPAL